MVWAQQDSVCSKLVPCKNGCCSSSGSCGFTEEHCGGMSFSVLALAIDQILTSTRWLYE